MVNLISVNYKRDTRLFVWRVSVFLLRSFRGRRGGVCISYVPAEATLKDGKKRFGPFGGKTEPVTVSGVSVYLDLLTFVLCLESMRVLCLATWKTKRRLC